jgi:catechol 2,3-dioxygenase-like lactoylglutathione lyase family enzyme
MRILALVLAVMAAPFADAQTMTSPTAPPPAAAKPSPVTTEPWLQATASVSDIDVTARFFREIGGYRTVWRGRLDRSELDYWGLPKEARAEALVLAAPGRTHGRVRLVQFEGVKKVPMRPGSRAWDTGCFFSLMVRAKGLDAIYDDAIRLGWWTETPITDLDFAGSTLKVVIFKGPDGLQVQAYERLSPALPAAFGDFERISQPFNIMQMVRDREAMRRLAEDVFGFQRFWFGPPYVEKTPTPMPLGIPTNLTTSLPYRAGIFYPKPDEFGRLEAIQIDGLKGNDYADRCSAPNLGWLSVSYSVADAEAAAAQIVARGQVLDAAVTRITRRPEGAIKVLRVRAPDGARIEFESRLAN